MLSCLCPLGGSCGQRGDYLNRQTLEVLQLSSACVLFTWQLTLVDMSRVEVPKWRSSRVNVRGSAHQSIRTRERHVPVLRNLAVGPSGGTCTGSYSTRTVGMTIGGCPGSWPHIPESTNGGGRKSRSDETDSLVISCCKSWAFTDLIFLQGEELVACRATADQFSTTIEGGQTQPENEISISSLKHF